MTDQKVFDTAARSTAKSHRSATIAAGLVLLAAWLRLWRLASTPPGLWFDEGFNAMEAVWMLKTQSWPIFILGGQGREVMFHYLLALSISGLGETVYVVRLVPALLGVISIPLMYRWVLTLYKEEDGAPWIAVLSSAALTVSFWYLIMNRVGYRANTLLPMLLLTGYFYWRGWQTSRMRFYLVAGIGLGLCQYTYLAGRLVPLIFIFFVLGQTLLSRQTAGTALKQAWLGLFVMFAVALLLVAPMILFFADYPELFWARGGDVSLKLAERGDASVGLSDHLARAGYVFVGGQDLNWRHHLPGRPVFDWFSIAGFLLGFAIALKRFRRPATMFLLIALLVMWLPALLSEPAFHTLRLVGILPAYYVLVALGWLTVAGWLICRLSLPLSRGQTGWITLTLLLLISGGSTFYDYFYRWAGRPEVYEAFDGRVVALAQRLNKSEETNLAIPFYLYTHASMRFLLNEQFREAVLLPDSGLDSPIDPNEASLIIPEYPPDDGKPPAYVWLVKNDPNPGMAYVSAVDRNVIAASLSLEAAASAEPIVDRAGMLLGHQYQVDGQQLGPLFPTNLPQKQASAVWVDNLALTGYEFIPNRIQAGQTTDLVLAWDIVGYTGLQEKMFLQLLDGRGQPVSQAELDPLSRKMYRWRDDGLILERHRLNLDAGLPSGLYFARLGFFDPESGRRLSLTLAAQQPGGDELIVGPLHVNNDGSDPDFGHHALGVKLGNEFELLGYSVYALNPENATEIELFWKTHRPVDVDYTVFIQLLDPQGQVIVQTDAQPLAGIYPTSRWQAGDIISDKFILPVAPDSLAGSGRLVTGMYDLASGRRLPTYNHQGDLLPDGLVYLTE